ncbi:solute carrier family 35 member B1-like isoform X2 [Ruditapes philippinarum]|uniref:solute carrier family 35 member B1-like isoform X2 n=1 Tax=Ruditapes philippinarum TaxID=129788 RepID=UPI00295BA3EB|nr:solute carrier family 35 member B1-like isoform X2 [Ruditapes philippinarum]
MANVKISIDEVGLISQVTENVEKDQEKKDFRKFLICALGIFVCHFILGILQESITKGKYGSGDHEEKFTYTLALVFVQCIINAICAKSAMALFSKDKDTTPMKMFAACSLTYLGAMLASNQSLQYISYPTQVLGKSVKPIPVMILGILFAGKRYPPAKFLFILMICIGVAMFMFKDKKPTAKEETHTFGFGEVLLMVSLTFDGLTGATQDRMRSNHKTGAYHMMLFVNLFSILWLALGLVFTGEGIAFLGFVQRYPSVMPKMVTFGIASAIGQVFIFITVTSFGPLPCSIITTTRKFFTILGSVILFSNPMYPRQWAGTVLVFMGLGLDSAYGKEKKDAKLER